MLLNASRAQLVAEVIAPALKAKTVVLCDRFFDATVAYQGVRARAERRRAARDLPGRDAPYRAGPDVFDRPPGRGVSRARVRARGGADRLEREDAAFHTRVRDGYLALAQQFANRFVILDGTQSPELLAASAREVLEERRNAPLR